jgi:hypothetical protein
MSLIRSWWNPIATWWAYLTIKILWASTLLFLIILVCGLIFAIATEGAGTVMSLPIVALAFIIWKIILLVLAISWVLLILIFLLDLLLNFLVNLFRPGSAWQRLKAEAKANLGHVFDGIYEGTKKFAREAQENFQKVVGGAKKVKDAIVDGVKGAWDWFESWRRKPGG